MRRIYLALAVYSCAFFLAAALLGLWVHSQGGEAPRSWHIRGGLFVAIFLCFVHSIVFIHLLGTGLGVKRAVEEHALPAEIRLELYRIKMRAFPPSMGSMVAVIATAVLGGAALSGHPTAHLVAAGVALVANVVTFPLAYRQLKENEAVLARVEGMVQAKAAAHVEPRER